MADQEQGYQIRLNTTVMPLVKLMSKRHEFSWANREEIARAIQECISEYENIRKEIGEHQDIHESSGAMKSTGI